MPTGIKRLTETPLGLFFNHSSVVLDLSRKKKFTCDTHDENARKTFFFNSFSPQNPCFKLLKSSKAEVDDRLAHTAHVVFSTHTPHLVSFTSSVHLGFLGFNLILVCFLLNSRNHMKKKEEAYKKMKVKMGKRNQASQKAQN